MLENGTYCFSEGLKFGAYIFTGNNNETGKLEDVLLPLMKLDNDSIFENAEIYLKKNVDSLRTYPLKLSVKNGSLTEIRSTKKGDTDFDEQKSLIGITGQLQRSGKPNTAYISDSDYLTLDKIRNNQKCIGISTFFNDFINYKQ